MFAAPAIVPPIVSGYGGSVMVRQGHAKPLLWTLECVSSACANLSVYPKEQRSLVHRKELGSQGLSAQRVGRLFQQQFCKLVLPDDLLYSQVSREHFQIWAEEWPAVDRSNTHGLPCSFFLTNYGTVGTMVDGEVLEAKGQQVPLHDGSSIALLRMAEDNGVITKLPFLEFCFSLDASMLTDAEAVVESAQPASTRERRSAGYVAPSPPRPPTESRKSSPPALFQPKASIGPEPDSPEPPSAPESYGDAIRGGISFAGPDVEPVFILEVGGTGIRDGVSSEQRSIFHGPRASACAVDPGLEAPCPPLCFGEGLQAGWWHKVVLSAARKALAQRHFQIEVEGVTLEDRRFSIRNMSAHALTVEGSHEDGPRTLEPNSKGQLHHGDTIYLCSEMGKSVWMAFREFMSSPSASCPDVSEMKLSALSDAAATLGTTAF